MSIISGVSLFQGFKYTGVQEYQMVAVKLSSQVSTKVVIMIDIAIRVSGEIVYGQVSQYQVKCISTKYLIYRCQIS